MWRFKLVKQIQNHVKEKVAAAYHRITTPYQRTHSNQSPFIKNLTDKNNTFITFPTPAPLSSFTLGLGITMFTRVPEKMITVIKSEIFNRHVYCCLRNNTRETSFGPATHHICGTHPSCHHIFLHIHHLLLAPLFSLPANKQTFNNTI